MFRRIDDRRIALNDWRDGDEVGQSASIHEQAGAESTRQPGAMRPIRFRSKI